MQWTHSQRRMDQIDMAQIGVMVSINVINHALAIGPGMNFCGLGGIG